MLQVTSGLGATLCTSRLASNFSLTVYWTWLDWGLSSTLLGSVITTSSKVLKVRVEAASFTRQLQVPDLSWSRSLSLSWQYSGKLEEQKKSTLFLPKRFKRYN